MKDDSDKKVPCFVVYPSPETGDWVWSEFKEPKEIGEWNFSYIDEVSIQQVDWIAARLDEKSRKEDESLKLSGRSHQQRE